MDREAIAAVAELMDESLLLLDGLDDAFIGVTTRCGQETLAVYSWERIMNIFVERDGMTYDEAAEFIDFNILGAWMGERTPAVLIELREELQEDPVVALEEKVESLSILVDSLKRLQDILLNDLDAWGRSCPKLLRRWMIGRMEKRRTSM